MKELPKNMRPYEKALSFGPSSLSDEELLAVFLRTGTREKNVLEIARDLLFSAGGTLQGLLSMTAETLRKVSGIGPVKALELQCLLVLSRRLSQEKWPDRPVFQSPEAVYAYYRSVFLASRREELHVLLLDIKCRLIREECVTVGSVSASMIPIREILVAALSCDAVRMILVHNHPSGDPAPSGEDISATRSLFAGTAAVGVTLLDHVIIGKGCYFSLKERGLFS